MDGRQFDLLARSFGIGSRRTLHRAALATLASSLWIMARAPDAAAACRGAGSRCRRSSQCCSGTCRKQGRKRRKKCAPLPANAHGCGTDDASCPNGDDGTPCPNLPTGRCRITVLGRPVCSVTMNYLCESCNENDDCLPTQGAGAICVRCESCPSGTTCICPFLD